MNKKHLHGGLILGTILALSAATYLLYRNNKKRYARMIADSGNSTQAVVWLVTLDEPYLRAWAKAVKGQQKVFTYQGKNYNTKGGKSA